jgi:hypothetical protein
MKYQDFFQKTCKYPILFGTALMVANMFIGERLYGLEVKFAVACFAVGWMLALASVAYMMKEEDRKTAKNNAANARRELEEMVKKHKKK